MWKRFIAMLAGLTNKPDTTAQELVDAQQSPQEAAAPVPASATAVVSQDDTSKNMSELQALVNEKNIRPFETTELRNQLSKDDETLYFWYHLDGAPVKDTALLWRLWVLMKDDIDLWIGRDISFAPWDHYYFFKRGCKVFSLGRDTYSLRATDKRRKRSHHLVVEGDVVIPKGMKTSVVLPRLNTTDDEAFVDTGEIRVPKGVFYLAEGVVYIGVDVIKNLGRIDKQFYGMVKRVKLWCALMGYEFTAKHKYPMRGITQEVIEAAKALHDDIQSAQLYRSQGHLVFQVTTPTKVLLVSSKADYFVNVTSFEDVIERSFFSEVLKKYEPGCFHIEGLEVTWFSADVK